MIGPEWFFRYFEDSIFSQQLPDLYDFFLASRVHPIKNGGSQGAAIFIDGQHATTLRGTYEELAAAFHSYYNRQRVLVDDPAVTQARLLLVNAVRIVLRNALGLLGMAAPERM